MQSLILITQEEDISELSRVIKGSSGKFLSSLKNLSEYNEASGIYKYLRLPHDWYLPKMNSTTSHIYFCMIKM